MSICAKYAMGNIIFLFYHSLWHHCRAMSTEASAATEYEDTDATPGTMGLKWEVSQISGNRNGFLISFQSVKQIGNKSNLSFPSTTAMANWVLSTNSGDE